MKKTIYSLSITTLLIAKAFSQSCVPLWPNSLSASASSGCVGSVVTLFPMYSGQPPFNGNHSYQWANITGGNVNCGSSGVLFGSPSNGMAFGATSPTLAAGLNIFTLRFTCSTGVQCNPTLTVAVMGIAGGGTSTAAAQYFCPGFSTSISLNPASATSYQWYNGTTVIPNATTSILSFSNPTIADAGMYNLQTTGSCGTSTTAVNFSTLPTPTIQGVNTTSINTTNIFSTPPVSGVSYSWSIAGSGTITGGFNSSSVTVNSSPSTSVYTLSLISGLNTCTVISTKTVSVTGPPPPPPATWLKYTFNLGTTINDLGANNTGTLTNSGTLTTDRFGNYNQAYNQAAINVGSVTAYSNATALSIVGWYKKPDTDADWAMYNFGGYMSRVYSGGGGFQNAPFSYNTFSKYTTPTIATYTNMAVGTWFHYAQVLDPSSGGTLLAYINGTLVGSNTPNSLNVGTPALGTSPLIFGDAFQGGSQWPTAYDDIFVVNRALTQTQIDSLRGLPNPGQLSTVGISKHQKNDFASLSVYPNPSNDNITVLSEAILKITITNLLGAVVAEAKTNDIIDVKSLPNGVYIIRPKEIGSTGYVKFIKQ